jgi:hypothetical protein
MNEKNELIYSSRLLNRISHSHSQPYHLVVIYFAQDTQFFVSDSLRLSHDLNKEKNLKFIFYSLVAYLDLVLQFLLIILICKAYKWPIMTIFSKLKC